MDMATKSKHGNSDWSRRLGLSDDEVAELERRADEGQRSFAAEIRIAVKAHLAPPATKGSPA